MFNFSTRGVQRRRWPSKIRHNEFHSVPSRSSRKRCSSEDQKTSGGARLPNLWQTNRGDEEARQEIPQGGPGRSASIAAATSGTEGEIQREDVHHETGWSTQGFSKRTAACCWWPDREFWRDRCWWVARGSLRCILSWFIECFTFGSCGRNSKRSEASGLKAKMSSLYQIISFLSELWTYGDLRVNG